MWSRHCGLGEECTTFFLSGILSEGCKIKSRHQLRKKVREKQREKIDQNWKRNEKRHARERPVTRERARTQRLDP